MSSKERSDGGTHLPKYEWVGELGSGRKGEIKLMRNRRTQELVAVKYIGRKVKLPRMQLTELLLVGWAGGTTQDKSRVCTGWRRSQCLHRERACQSPQAIASKHHQVSLHSCVLLARSPSSSSHVLD